MAVFNDLPPNKKPRIKSGYGSAKKARETIKKLKKEPKQYQYQLVHTLYSRAKYHKYKQIFGWDDEKNHIERLMVKQKTLNSIIREEIPELTHIDILSLDIEGYELQCLKGLDLLKYPPKVMVIENCDHDVSIQEYLKSFDYRLDKTISYNEYYVHSSKKDLV